MTTLNFSCGENVFTVVLPDHARAHEWPNGLPGPDVVNVYPRSFTLLRTTVLEGVIVRVATFYYLKNQEFKVFNGDTLNLTDYIPTTVNKTRLVLVGFDLTTETLGVVAGDESFNSALTPPPVPTGIPTTFIPSALVRLVTNTTEIFESDISDARTFFTLGSSGSTPAVQTWPGPGEIIIGDTLYDTIEEAFAAATSGDVVKLGEGTFILAGDTTVPSGVDIMGSGLGVTTLSSSTLATLLDCQGGNRLSDFLIIDGSDSATVVAFAAGAGENRVDRVSITGDIGIAMAGGIVNLLKISASEIYGTTTGLLTGSNSSAFLAGCYIYSPATAIDATAGEIWPDFGSISYVSGAVTGTVVGWLNVDGNLQSFGDVYLISDELASAPTTPPTNSWALYFKSDGLYHVDDTGAEVGPLGSGGGVWPRDGKATIDSTEYATIQAAENAGSGAVIKIGGGTFAENLILDGGNTLKGTARRGTIISQSAQQITVEIDQGANLQDIEARNAATGTYAIGMRVDAGASSESLFSNCRFYANSGNDTTEVYGGLAFDDARFIDCDFVAGRGEDTLGCAIMGGNVLFENSNCFIETVGVSFTIALAVYSGTVTVKGGRFDGLGSGEDIYISGGTLRLEGPTLVNGALYVAGGTVTGWYVNGVTGDIVVVGTSVIKGIGSNFPNLGSTTLAEKMGHIYLGTGKDLYPSNDGSGLWNRLINFNKTPDEHWAQGADQITWAGYAAYTGYGTPSIIITGSSQYSMANPGAIKAFRYRAASTGAAIYLRCRVSLGYLCSAGVMIDDGVDTGDGEGANNFYRVYITHASIAGPWQAVQQSRQGGGAVATVTATLTLAHGQFYGVMLSTSPTTLWSNWYAVPSIFGESGFSAQFTSGAGIQTWTPARVGLYWVGTAVDGGRKGIWDWYDEATA